MIAGGLLYSYGATADKILNVMLETADLAADGIIDVSDLIAIINIILGIGITDSPQESY